MRRGYTRIAVLPDRSGSMATMRGDMIGGFNVPVGTQGADRTHDTEAVAMASQDEHEQDCRRELGEPFSAVHEWLDELQPEYGPMHRAFRHNREGVEQMRARFGDAAARAAEIHIRRDTGGRVLSAKELRDYWGVRVEDVRPESDAG